MMTPFYHRIEKIERTEIKIFLMSDAVDLARNATKKPDFYEYDLVQMLKELYEDRKSVV